jgi:hypothetical protein
MQIYIRLQKSFFFIKVSIDFVLLTSEFAKRTKHAGTPPGFTEEYYRQSIKQ